MLLAERGAEVKIFESAGESFHLKAYIFIRTRGDAPVHGEFFIGSSNISWTALNTGLEWNYRVLIDENSDPLQIASFETIRERFAQLFAHPKSIQEDALAALAATRKEGYRRLLGHFKPRFLLGLTATPERTDQSDILSFCDDNLVFSYNLFDGVSSEHLVPFHYHGIFDETVEYAARPVIPAAS